MSIIDAGDGLTLCLGLPATAHYFSLRKKISPNKILLFPRHGGNILLYIPFKGTVSQNGFGV
jgi:hypothetical protein